MLLTVRYLLILVICFTVQLPLFGCGDCSREIVNSAEDYTENGLLVFISFSMPEVAIRELHDNLEKYNATLIIRGLHKESFLETKDKILSINKDGIRMDINPELFSKYDVQIVPTFIYVRDGVEQNRLSGNVSMEFAHEKLTGADL